MINVFHKNIKLHEKVTFFVKIIKIPYLENPLIKKISLFFLAPLLVIFITTRIFFTGPTFLDKAMSLLISPILRISNTITRPVKIFLKKRGSYNKLLENHIALIRENKKLLQENIELAAFAHYAEKSSDLREFQDRYALKNSILSKVLIKSFTQSDHSITVNRGSRNGVQKDMVAIYKFQLIGRVTTVFPTYSKITLITDAQSKVSAYTNTSSALGVVKGTNTVNRCELGYVSHLKTIHNGDFVLSSGQGLIFPEGFCIGKITNVKTKDLCHHVEITPLIDLSSIEMCHLTGQSKMNLF